MTGVPMDLRRRKMDFAGLTSTCLYCPVDLGPLNSFKLHGPGLGSSFQFVQVEFPGPDQSYRLGLNFSMDMTTGSIVSNKIWYRNDCTEYLKSRLSWKNP